MFTFNFDCLKKQGILVSLGSLFLLSKLSLCGKISQARTLQRVTPSQQVLAESYEKAINITDQLWSKFWVEQFKKKKKV